MNINKIKIHNYRNLDGLDISFDSNCNFIVGENNIGKSNFLDLLKIVFKYNSFEEDDYFDKDKPIEIELSLQLSEIEIGHFGDLFNPTNNAEISIICRQNIKDDYLQFLHKETDTNISRFDIRSLNFIYYDSLRNPMNEISFDRGRGVGKFLTKIITFYLAENNLHESDFLKIEPIKKIIEEINSKLVKIKTFKDFAIKAEIDKEITNILPKIIVLQESGKYNLSISGHGVQFLILITLSILEQIDNVMSQKRGKTIFENENKKYISLVLGLDEPEIHLHPYMQRSLIKYLNCLILNKNQEFQELLKEMFDLDGFNGQIIIATHSPNIILNDYEQIIRFYPTDDSTVKVISGKNLKLEEQIIKHLYLQFPFVKEAFFSRCVIFVEGETELGVLTLFAEKLGIDLDEYGISIIKASGKEAIKPLIKVMSCFSIKGIGLMDKDNSTDISSFPIYLTDKRDFEEDLISKLLSEKKENQLRKIVTDYDSKGLDRVLEKDSINKRLFSKNSNPKYTDIDREIDKNLKLRDCKNEENFRYFYLTWFLINKSITLGRLIGEKLEKDDIPEIYKTLIKKAVELVSS